MDRPIPLQEGILLFFNPLSFLSDQVPSGISAQHNRPSHNPYALAALRQQGPTGGIGQLSGKRSDAAPQGEQSYHFRWP